MTTKLKQTAALAAVTIALSTALTAQEHKQETRQEARTDVEFRVCFLQYADARDSKVTIEDLIVPQTARMTVDPRTNSILITGNKQELDFVVDLIKQLDVPPKRKATDETMFESYPFPDPQSLQQGFHLFQSMLAGEHSVKMDMDANSLNLYLQGTDRHHQIARNLIKELSQAAATLQSTNVHVASYLIVDGSDLKDRAAELKKPQGKLGQVLSAATEKGLVDISQPLVASQISSLASSAPSSGQTRGKQANQASQANGYFDNQSSGDWFQFHNDGVLMQISRERFKLKSRVEINLRTSDDVEHLAEISGDIELPLNHPVLLSFSTIGGIDSAVIIILTNE